MTIELTTSEQRVLVSALEAYRRIKGAERMLRSQALRDETARTASYATYDRLLSVVKRLQEKLT